MKTTTIIKISILSIISAMAIALYISGSSITKKLIKSEQKIECFEVIDYKVGEFTILAFKREMNNDTIITYNHFWKEYDVKVGCKYLLKFKLKVYSYENDFGDRSIKNEYKVEYEHLELKK